MKRRVLPSAAVSSRILPAHFDHTYRGHKLGLLLFGLYLFVRLAMSINSIVNGRMIATSADGIPLDTFPAAAADAIVTLFALLGLCRLMGGLLGVVVLLRYRSMISLMFALFLVEHLARYLVLRVYPITRAATPVAFGINSALLVILVLGLSLSLLHGARTQQ
jgi:hypothetical protein